MITRAILFAITTILSVGFGFLLLNIEQIGILLRFLAYPTLFAGLGLWIFLGIRSLAPSSPLAMANRKGMLILILSCLAGTLFLFTREEREYKILFDEPAIINASLNLHVYRDPVQKEHTHSKVDSVSLVDKRPFFFAFFVSLLHDLFGYSLTNGHIANFLITFAFLLAIYHLLTLIKNQRAGWYGIVAFCCLPLMSQNASGLGFEIANLFMIVVLMISGLMYWKDPTNEKLGFFLLSTILLSHTRYESALYTLPTAIIILSKWIQTRKVSISWILISTPFFFVPLAWQNRIVQDQSAMYMQIETNDFLSAFGFHYIPVNLHKAWTYFTGLNQDLAGSLILGPTGIIAFACILAYLFRKPRERIFDADLLPVVLVGATILTLFLLLMSYYWGTLTDPVATRLSLPVWLLLLISLSVLLSTLSKRYKFLPPSIFVLALIHAMPIMATHPYSNSNLAMERYKWVESIIGPELDHRSLVITNMVRMYQNRRIPSCGMDRLNYISEKIDLHLHLKTYKSIYVIQYGHYNEYKTENEKQINDGYKAGPMFELETVAETSLYPYNFTRISRITGVDMSVLKEESHKPNDERPYIGKKRVEYVTISKEAYHDWEETLP